MKFISIIKIFRWQVIGHLLLLGSLLLAPMEGELRALLDSQYSVEIVMEHQITGHLKDYPIVIIPEWEYIKPELKMEMLNYTKKGGNLLIIGPKTAASISNYGKGKIAAIYFNFGERYLHGATVVAREFFSGLIKELFPKPMAEIKGSHYVDVSINTIDGKLAVNLVNTSGPHANSDIYVFDDIPKVGPLDVTIRLENKPKKITLEPEGRELEYQYINGEVSLILNSLEIHKIILVEL